jgi:hypothetical protein
MKSLEPVMMRMAKQQKTTLDPSKISGHCGRLMCCLRFEDETYADLRKNLPQRGSIVKTEEVEGQVIDQNILTQTCLIVTQEGERVMIAVDDIIEKKYRKNSRSSSDKKDNKRENKNCNTKNCKNKSCKNIKANSKEEKQEVEEKKEDNEQQQ